MRAEVQGAGEAFNTLFLMLKNLNNLGSAVWGGVVQYIARVDAFRANYQVPDGETLR